MQNNTNNIIEDLKVLAERYEVSSFIKNDPVQFPHRYTVKQDIEISGFIAAWLAYGSRQVFIPLLDEIHAMMGSSPLEYILSEEYLHLAGNRSTMYRFCKWDDLYQVYDILHAIYSGHSSMEEWILLSGDTPLHTLQKQFGHLPQLPLYGGTSACKKLHMFLRWMIRKNSPVDLGIWKCFHPDILFVPVDTHVLQQAQQLQITNRKQADRKTVEEITAFGRRIFPDDPSRIDFALYGSGISRITGVI